MCKHIYNIKATANILDSLTNMHSEKLVDIYQMVNECTWQWWHHVTNLASFVRIMWQTRNSARTSRCVLCGFILGKIYITYFSFFILFYSTIYKSPLRENLLEVLVTIIMSWLNLRHSFTSNEEKQQRLYHYNFGWFSVKNQNCQKILLWRQTGCYFGLC